jgi:hypothetical protein
LIIYSLWHVILKGKGNPDHWYPYQKSVRKTRVMRERAAKQVRETTRNSIVLGGLEDENASKGKRVRNGD